MRKQSKPAKRMSQSELWRMIGASHMALVSSRALHSLIPLSSDVPEFDKELFGRIESYCVASVYALGGLKGTLEMALKERKRHGRP
jgi:hypothetical protein